MKHVLIVAFHFPPESSSSGVLRTAKFARYLSDFGWRVSVLTIDTSAYAAQDASLLASVPESVTVVRSRYWPLRKVFSIRGKYPSFLVVPDAWLGWYPFAVTAGLSLARRSRVDAVFSTSPHATAHLIAQRIAGRLRIPSVIDFRDPWYEEPPEPGTPYLVHVAARHLERRVVSKARYIVASTFSLRSMLLQRYAELPSERFVAIANGFDDADFSNITVGANAPADKLVVVHAGSINVQFRDPRPLLDAFGRLIQAGAISGDELLLHFAGPGEFAGDRQLLDCIDRNQLQNSVRFTDRLKYADSLQLMANADLLLLLQASPDTTALVPAKLYEYMRVQRPVLALVLPGASTDVLEATGGGWSCDPGDTSALDGRLAEIVDLWRARKLPRHGASPEKLGRFERRALTAELAALLDHAVEEVVR